MATSQTNTQVNARAAKGDPMPKLKGNVIPGQSGVSYQDNGGPTNTDYNPDNDSAKLDHHEPSQTSTQINDKGGGTQKTGGGTSKTSIDSSGYGSDGKSGHDGTKSGRSNPGPTKLGGAAKYEEAEAEVDETAKEQLDELSDSQEASDDFKARAKVIFEAALNEKLKLEVTRLEEEFSTRFEEEIKDIAEKVESFLNYTSQQWLEENKLVVENGIRNELSESFVQGLRSLFEEHYVTLPDEKYDIFESMVTKLDEMENKLNEQIEANVELNSRMAVLNRDAIVNEVSWDLSEAGKEKLAGLAENVEFESEDIYRQKLTILKESFAPSEEETPKNQQMLDEETEVLAPTPEETMDDAMSVYARALSRTVR